jgi:hypothetical protein
VFDVLQCVRTPENFWFGIPQKSALRSAFFVHSSLIFLYQHDEDTHPDNETDATLTVSGKFLDTRTRWRV